MASHMTGSTGTGHATRYKTSRANSAPSRRNRCFKGTDSTLLRIADAVLRDKLASDPAFASRFYRALCVFMADRLRHTTTRMGYGNAAEDSHAKDELNDDLLDNVHLAGARFDRMLKRLAG